MSLRRLNLNLIPILMDLLVTRNVTRTGERIGLSQSAVSAALAKLREVLEDEVLVQIGREMQPTERAKALTEPLARNLNELARLLAPSAFEPATSDRRFVIASADHALVVLGPELARRVHACAPDISFSFVDIPADANEQLRLGILDLVLRPAMAAGQEQGRSERLFSDTYVILAPDEPHVPDTMDLNTYLGFKHAIRVAAGGDEIGFIHDAIRRADIGQSNVILAPQFTVLAEFVEATGCLAIMQKTLATRQRRQSRVKLIEPPFPIGRLELLTYWDGFRDDDPGLVWMRGMLREAARAAGLDP